MSAASVLTPRRFGRLLLSDAMNVGRDPMLLFATVLSAIPSIALFLGRDALDEAAFAAFGLAAFSLYLVPVALLMPAFLIGWVTGFLLLEDRDEKTLMALDVTPIGKAGFFVYRATVTALLAMAVTLLGLALVLPQASPGERLLILGLVPAEAVIAAIVLPAIARNKVEGLALTKLTNIMSVVPLLAIIPSPWRLIAGIVPSYWVGELLGLSGTQPLPFPIVAAAAVLTHMIWGVVLFRWFIRRTD
jgi:fluoroquinolone transport system permease protein